VRPDHAGIFHVTTRSIAEEHIFRDDRDYLAGVQLVGELSRDGLIVCHGFCLMPTHYHLLASFDEGMLKRAIHRLNRRYATGFNRRHNRLGHVFDSPDDTPFSFVQPPPWAETHQPGQPRTRLENAPPTRKITAEGEEEPRTALRPERKQGFEP
jgi:REP element-mobilizing transposase RayT